MVHWHVIFITPKKGIEHYICSKFEPMFKNVFRNWNLMRALRTGIGILLIVQAFYVKDWLIGLLGGFFAFQGLTNTGCCATNSCSINPVRDKKEVDTEKSGLEAIK